MIFCDSISCAFLLYEIRTDRFADPDDLAHLRQIEYMQQSISAAEGVQIGAIDPRRCRSQPWGSEVLGPTMSEPLSQPDKAAVHRMMARLDGFARGLGLDEGTTRTIVETVVADMPDQSDEERLAEARRRMIVASA
ncbi:hypothetical protein ACLBXB_20810 [Methylobacterium mesophilicum]